MPFPHSPAKEEISMLTSIPINKLEDCHLKHANHTHSQVSPAILLKYCQSTRQANDSHSTIKPIHSYQT